MRVRLLLIFSGAEVRFSNGITATVRTCEGNPLGKAVREAARQCQRCKAPQVDASNAGTSSSRVIPSQSFRDRDLV